ncbi:MAG: hypothetical protein MUF76_13430 [Hydrogenophaga sp.]|jgi:hypothetical protein|nr:hypothetical protein [Hydrogenophaga sp.]
MKQMQLELLDQATAAIATPLYAGLQERKAPSLRFTYRVTPDGSVSAPDYWFKSDNSETEVKDYPSDAVHEAVVEAARAHWRLTQDLGLPRWYKLIMSVQRGGKFSVDFEYKDDYKEGDMMRQL